MCGCPGWSESSLGAQMILLVLLCVGSFYKHEFTIAHSQMAHGNMLRARVLNGNQFQNMTHLENQLLRDQSSLKCQHFSYRRQQCWNLYLSLSMYQNDFLNFVFILKSNFKFYNAITQNNCFIKGSHKYDVYLVEENKAHLNGPNKDRIVILVLTQHDVACKWRQRM